jgi:hypothetical protein
VTRLLVKLKHGLGNGGACQKGIGLEDLIAEVDLLLLEVLGLLLKDLVSHVLQELLLLELGLLGVRGLFCWRPVLADLILGLVHPLLHHYLVRGWSLFN